MTEPYYSDDAVTLYRGDALAVLSELPDQSVDCVVTSPPYFGLRDYGVDGQQGLEASPAEYVSGMVAVFEQVRRVLAADGTCWLNIGDSYSGSWGNQGRKSERGTQRPITTGMLQPVHDGRYGDTSASRTGAIRPGAPPAKNLMGMPWRLALALQEAGWTLRSDIIWSKPNAMPESVTDRPSSRHEHVFLLTKSARYWFDLDPIREPHTTSSIVVPWQERVYDQSFLPASHRQDGSKGRVSGVAGYAENGRNPGDVWSVPTQGLREAHFAVMPVALAERCVQAGCKPGGTVLDPYSGSGTTGLAAARHGRRYVGIDLNRDYLDLSLRTRLQQTALTDGAAS